MRADGTLDLFAGLGSAPEPPLVARARQRGHRAAALAAARADRVQDEWTVKAIAWTRQFADRRRDTPWLMEEARAFAEDGGLEAPPDKRAWGHVVQALKRQGVLRSMGTGAARSSHGSPKVRWVRA
jgi:hypothetical protein